MTKSKRSADGNVHGRQQDGVSAGPNPGDELIRPEFFQVFLEYPNIWQIPPINVEPEKWLDSWRIAKVVRVAAHPEHYGFHFVGRNIMENCGAVSSKIERFDPHSMSGVTRSGRVYRLVGPPGSNADAEYTFNYWLQANRAEAVDATEEFIKQYGISVEHVKKLSG